MKIALSEVVSDLNRNRKTGLLAVSVKGLNSLFKIFLRDGNIYHVACGSAKGSTCLAQCDEMEFSGYSFLPDIVLEVSGENMPPTGELIQYLQVAGKTVDAQEGSSGETQVNSGASAFPRIREQLKAALIDQVGPAGAKAFTRIVEEKWRPSSTPSREDLVKLVDLLRNVIDDVNDRQQFFKDATRIISS